MARIKAMTLRRPDGLGSSGLKITGGINWKGQVNRQAALRPLDATPAVGLAFGCLQYFAVRIDCLQVDIEIPEARDML